MKKFVKKFLTIVVLISYVLLQFPVTLLAQGNDNNLNDGDIVGTNPVTSTKDANGVELKKTISKTSNSNEYEVTLEVKGENQVATTSTEVPIYTVIVFDRSGSMQNFCIGAISEFFSGGNGRVYGKGTEESCYFDDINQIYLKWSNAVAGARSFARNLNSRISNAQIALVTFADEASVNRGFSASNLDTASFGKPKGGTNIAAGLDSAKSLLASAPESAKKVVVFIGDGEPEVTGDIDIDIADTLSKANELKSNDIEIYSIGYDGIADENNYHSLDDNAKEVLRNIASDTNHYSYSNPDTISTSLNNLITSISTVPAGTNATITDTIGDGFEYVEGSASDAATLSEDKTTIKFNVGEITETGKTVTFKIRLKDNLQPDEYETNNTSNDGVNVSYTSYDGSKKTNSINESSKVYHNPDLSYTVKYYKDSVSDSNYLGEVSGNGKLNDTITVDENLKKPAKGYAQITDNKDFTLDEDNKTINVVYTKKNTLSYIVQYFKELANGEEKLSDDNDNTVTGKKYKDVVTVDDIAINKYLPIFGYKKGTVKTEMPYTIDDDQNIIKVCYERRNDLSYTVKYVDENNEEILPSEVIEGKTYNETFEESAKEAPEGYVLDDEETKEITVDKEVNELVFNYKIIKVNYTINEYYDDELTNTYEKEVKYGEELTFEEKDGYTLEVEYLDNNVINLYYKSIKTETYEVPPKTNVNNTYYLYLLLSLIIVGLVKVKKLD